MDSRSLWSIFDSEGLGQKLKVSAEERNWVAESLQANSGISVESTAISRLPMQSAINNIFSYIERALPLDPLGRDADPDERERRWKRFLRTGVPVK